LKAYDSNQIHSHDVGSFIYSFACVEIMWVTKIQSILQLNMMWRNAPLYDLFSLTKPLLSKWKANGPSEYVDNDTNIFGLGASIEKFSRAIIRIIFLFRKLLGLLATCDDPLAQWHINEKKFPNVAFLAKQIIGILVTNWNKRSFNLVGMMTSLQRYHLQVENLDQIIILVKTWSNDPHFTCKKKVNMKKYMKA
jgi:hypothetical protein